MSNPVAQAARDLLGPAYEPIRAVVFELVGPTQRISPMWLMSAAGVVALIYVRRSRALGNAPTSRGFREFLAPREVWRHPSTRADIRLWLANVVLFFTALHVLLLGAHVIAGALEGVLVPREGDASAIGVVASVLTTFLALELGDYWHHRAFHRVGILWEFHKVHHSAEVLTPVTAYREHPVDIITRSLFQAVFVGVTVAFVVHFVPGAPAPRVIGVELILLPYLFLNALRHSHVWLSFGPFWSRIFSSPAQHQCHHGTDPHHIDVNYGVSLSLWDWVFGTLYVPIREEPVRYGLLGVAEQPHPTLRAMYGQPFVEAARRVRTGELLNVVPASRDHEVLGQ